MTAQPKGVRDGAAPTVPPARPRDPLVLAPAPAAPPDPIPPPEPVLRGTSFAGCGWRDPRKGRKPKGARLAARDEQRQRGSVTVEMVGVVPLLVAVTLAMVGVIAVARDQVLAQGAAREGAREAALAGGQGRAAAAARAVIPAGRTARVTVAADGQDRVRVTVELATRMPFGAPTVTVRGEGVALREPGLAVQPAGP
jgi:TadE-like protein